MPLATMRSPSHGSRADQRHAASNTSREISRLESTHTVRWLRVDERDRDHKKISQHCGEASVRDIGKHEEKIDLWRINGNT